MAFHGAASGRSGRIAADARALCAERASLAHGRLPDRPRLDGAGDIGPHPMARRGGRPGHPDGRRGDRDRPRSGARDLVLFRAVRGGDPGRIAGGGDFAAAHRALDDLQSLAAQHGLAIWQAGGRCVRMALQATQGEPVPVQTLQAGLRTLRATGFMAHFAWLSGVMAEAVGGRGEYGAGIAWVDEGARPVRTNRRTMVPPRVAADQGQPGPPVTTRLWQLTR